MTRILKWLGKTPQDYPGIFRFIMNSWPPYLGAGVKVEFIAADWRTIRVAMKQHWYNSNYVHKHFGGSLFAMTDPFYMLMLLRNLGHDFIVWDAAAEIRFLQPGEGRVSAVFQLDDARLAEIMAKLESKRRLLEKFTAEIVDEQQRVVATVEKTVYIRKKVESSADRVAA